MIDTATAERLRVFERASQPVDGAAPPGALSAFFGPAVGVGELLGYTGAVFLLLGWHAFTDTFILGYEPQAFGVRTIQFGAPFAALMAMAAAQAGRDGRWARAAGVAFVAATAYAAIAAGQLVQWAVGPVEPAPLGLVASAAALLAAGVARWIHPAVLSQLALVGALVALLQTALIWLETVAFAAPEPFTGDLAEDPVRGAVRVGVTLAWWLTAALGFGLLAEAETVAGARDGRAEPRAGANRRAAVSRFTAGLVAIAGTGIAVTQSVNFERVVDPALGDVAILVVAGVLLAVAFRTGFSAYLYPAAIGLIVALTDVNVRVVASSSGIAAALIFEGLVLVAAGYGATQLSREVTTRRSEGAGVGVDRSAVRSREPA